MSIFTDLFGKGVSDVIDKVGDKVDQFVLTKQEKFDAEQHQTEMEWRFKEYEAENFQKEQDRLLEYYKQDALDRTNARDFAKTEIASGDKFVSHFRYWFAAGICLIIFLILTGIIFYDLPKERENIVMFILGILSTTFTSIVSFYFGSSSGSSIKDNVIQKQATQLGDK